MQKPVGPTEAPLPPVRGGRARSRYAPCVVSGAVTLVFVIAVIHALGFKAPHAATMPILVGSATALLAAAVFIRDLRLARATPGDEDGGSTGATDPAGPPRRPSSDTGDEVGYPTLRVVVFFACLVLCTFVLGLQVGAPLFLLIAMKLVLSTPWRPAILAAIASIIALSWIWPHVLDLPTYGGVFHLPLL